MERLHRAVLLRETLEVLSVRPGGLYGDMTFGEGGHSEALLAAGAGRVLAIDRDSEAVERYQAQGAFRGDPRLELRHGTLAGFAASYSGQKFDGVVADLGVSTGQLLTAERGFSLQADGPLDMRMDRTDPLTLEDYLGAVSVERLAEDLERAVDLPGARRMATKILKAHQKGELRRTADLARVAGGKWSKTHPATPVFLALRMIVNEEYQQVEKGIPQLPDLLLSTGRLAVITFHSTEDRLVKRAFALLAGRCICAAVPCACPRTERVRWVNPKPIVAAEDELNANPRARSAKLRCIEKLVWPS